LLGQHRWNLTQVRIGCLESNSGVIDALDLADNLELHDRAHTGRGTPREAIHFPQIGSTTCAPQPRPHGFGAILKLCGPTAVIFAKRLKYVDGPTCRAEVVGRVGEKYETQLDLGTKTADFGWMTLTWNVFFAPRDAASDH
jgi:hypothetical protein